MDTLPVESRFRLSLNPKKNPNTIVPFLTSSSIVAKFIQDMTPTDSIDVPKSCEQVKSFVKLLAVSLEDNSIDELPLLGARNADYISENGTLFPIPTYPTDDGLEGSMFSGKTLLVVDDVVGYLNMIGCRVKDVYTQAKKHPQGKTASIIVIPATPLLVESKKPRPSVKTSLTDMKHNGLAYNPHSKKFEWFRCDTEGQYWYLSDTNLRTLCTPSEDILKKVQEVNNEQTCRITTCMALAKDNSRVLAVDFTIPVVPPCILEPDASEDPTKVPISVDSLLEDKPVTKRKTPETTQDSPVKRPVKKERPEVTYDEQLKQVITSIRSLQRQHPEQEDSTNAAIMKAIGGVRLFVDFDAENFTETTETLTQSEPSPTLDMFLALVRHLDASAATDPAKAAKMKEWLADFQVRRPTQLFKSGNVEQWHQFLGIYLFLKTYLQELLVK